MSIADENTTEHPGPEKEGVKEIEEAQRVPEGPVPTPKETEPIPEPTPIEERGQRVPEPPVPDPDQKGDKSTEGS